MPARSFNSADAMFDRLISLRATRPLWVFTPSTSGYSKVWAAKALASVETLFLRYVYKVTDPNRMAPDFRTAFIYALAVAMPGIGNISAAREAELLKEAKSRLNRAKSADAMGSTPERRPTGSWHTSRGGWRRGRVLPR